MHPAGTEPVSSAPQSYTLAIDYTARSREFKLYFLVLKTFEFFFEYNKMNWI